MTGRAGIGTAVLLAAALAGCQSETRDLGSGAPGPAPRGGWSVGGGGAPEDGGAGRDEPAAPRRPPGEVVEVPLDAYRPLDQFFDNEGYLLADRIEIDCSYNPFMARMVGLSYDHSAAFVVRDEGQQGDVYTVRLRNASAGAAYQENLIPLVTFGSQRLPPPPERDPSTGRPVLSSPRPFFEFVGTEEILLRFHMTSSPERPVWFQARALGTEMPNRPGEIRPAIYRNLSRRKPEVKGTELALLLEIRRGPDGAWEPVVRDPEPGATGPATGGR